jgi:copper chaperone NosL
MHIRINLRGPRLVVVTALLAAAACSSGPVGIDRGASCAYCRMTISSPRLAAEIVAPGEEPRFYDDIGCLVNGIARGDQRSMGADATAYVADHRTGAWVKASDAVYTRVDALDTPMASHLIAHADAASRAADRDAASGVPLGAADVLAKAQETPRDAR